MPVGVCHEFGRRRPKSNQNHQPNTQTLLTDENKRALKRAGLGVLLIWVGYRRVIEPFSMSAFEIIQNPDDVSFYTTVAAFWFNVGIVAIIGGVYMLLRAYRRWTKGEEYETPVTNGLAVGQGLAVAFFALLFYWGWNVSDDPGQYLRENPQYVPELLHMTKVHLYMGYVMRAAAVIFGAIWSIKLFFTIQERIQEYRKESDKLKVGIKFKSGSSDWYPSCPTNCNTPGVYMVTKDRSRCVKLNGVEKARLRTKERKQEQSERKRQRELRRIANSIDKAEKHLRMSMR